ncbi:MAG TPA: TadE/TadG family type IV pilus assembly protein [Alphaproteobacteria bacterium]
MAGKRAYSGLRRLRSVGWTSADGAPHAPQLPPPRRSLRALGDDRGSVATEFVVTLPILTILLFGFIGMGQLIWFHHIVTKGVRDGVRYLSRVPYEDGFIAQAKQIAMTGLPSGGTVFQFWTDPASIQVARVEIPNDGAFRTQGPVPVVRMTATVQVDLPVLGYGLLGMSPLVTYTVADEARWIGQ